jgi:hypothetical protein
MFGFSCFDIGVPRITDSAHNFSILSSSFQAASSEGQSPVIVNGELIDDPKSFFTMQT